MPYTLTNSDIALLTEIANGLLQPSGSAEQTAHLIREGFCTLSAKNGTFAVVLTGKGLKAIGDDNRFKAAERWFKRSTVASNSEHGAVAREALDYCATHVDEIPAPDLDDQG